MHNGPMCRVSGSAFSKGGPEGETGSGAGSMARRRRVRVLVRAAVSAVVLSLLTAASCRSPEERERDCPPFPPAAADDWATVPDVDTSATYTAASGEIVVLTLSSREDSEAYVGFDRVDSARIVCEASSVRRFTTGSAGEAIRIEFQLRLGGRTNGSPTDSELGLSIVPEAPVGTGLGFGFSFALDPLPVDDDLGSLSTTSYPDGIVVGGAFHERAVEARFSDRSIADRSPLPSLALVRVVMALDGGLVEFERLDGEVFVRTDPPSR